MKATACCGWGQSKCNGTTMMASQVGGSDSNKIAFRPAAHSLKCFWSVGMSAAKEGRARKMMRHHDEGLLRHKRQKLI